MELLSVFTKDRQYQETIPAIRREKDAGKEIRMCWVIESHIEKGRLIGLEEGRLAGREEEARLTARMLFKNNVSMELVSACIPHLSPEKLLEIYEQVRQEGQ